MSDTKARPVSLSTLKRNNRSLKRALKRALRKHDKCREILMENMAMAESIAYYKGKDNWTTLILDVNAKRNGRTE